MTRVSARSRVSRSTFRNGATRTKVGTRPPDRGHPWAGCRARWTPGRRSRRHVRPLTRRRGESFAEINAAWKQVSESQQVMLEALRVGVQQANVVRCKGAAVATIEPAPLAAVLGVLTYWQLCLVAVLQMVARMAFDAAGVAQLRTLVPPADHGAANGRSRRRCGRSTRAGRRRGHWQRTGRQRGGRQEVRQSHPPIVAVRRPGSGPPAATGRDAGPARPVSRPGGA